MSWERILVLNLATCDSRHQEMVCKKVVRSIIFGSVVGAARVVTRLAFTHGFASSNVCPATFLKHLMEGDEGFNVAAHAPSY